MKSISPAARLCAALALATGLAACGGYTSVSLGGSIFGLTTDGLILANGTDTVTVAANSTTYKFPQQIGNYASYAVTIKQQPSRLTCVLGNNTGTASGVDITYVNVTCSQNTYALGGTVANLTGSGLKLTNGSDTLDVAAGATTFTFANKVADGSVYGVAVLQQPTGQTCAVANGTAVMGGADVTSVQVTCTP